MFFLKQSTAYTLKIGPFLDSVDGDTEEGALAIAQADVRLSKNGGNYAQKNDANAAVYDETGMYECEIDATDTNTLGRLQLNVHVAGALSVWHEFHIVPANVYDSLVAGSDTLEVDTVAISGDTGAADNAELDYDGTGYAKPNSTIGTCTTNTDLVTAAAVVNEWEAQSQADPTGFHVNVLEVSGTNQTANDIGADANTIVTNIGTPVALDGGAATLGAMLTKMADDNGGADFDAADDSLERIANTAPLGTAMRGTDNAALAANYTAPRAANLDNLDAAVSSRSSHTANDVRDAILDDAMRFSGADIDTAISTRSSHTAADAADAVWDEVIAVAHVGAGSAGEAQKFTFDIEGGRWRILFNAPNWQQVFYEDDNVTEVARFNLLDIAGNPADPAMTPIAERVRV